MGLKSLSPLLVLSHFQVPTITAERIKMCNFYSAEGTTNKVEYCDLFYEKCCPTGCCPLQVSFPWWVWVLMGGSVFVILFCWCFTKVCLKKLRKNDNVEAIPLEMMNENSSENGGFALKTTAN